MKRERSLATLPAEVRKHCGKWVAVDANGVVAVRDSRDALVEVLRADGRVDAFMLRVPAEGEPEFVGLG